MRLNNTQKGFTLTPALLVLVLLLMGGVTYLIYVNTSSKSSRKIEKSQIARSIAETGIYQIKAQLSKLNEDDGTGKIVNKWYKAKNYDNYCIFTRVDESTCNNRVSASGVARVSDLIDVKDEKGNVIGKYRISIEDGSYVSASKTQTGSLIEGKDRYGNNIWSDINNPVNKNYFPTERLNRYGVRVDGFTVKSNGSVEPSSQSVYAVIDVPNNSDMSVFTTWLPGFPSGYFLTTDGFEDMPDPTPDRYLTLIGGQLITGKIHSNNRIDFSWNGNFDIFNPNRPSINERYTVTHGRWGGAADPSPIGIKNIVREVGQPSNEVTIYGTNFSLDKTKTSIVINGGTPINPTYVEEGKDIIPPATTETPVGFATKLKINFPTTTTFPCTLDITSLDRSQTIRYIINSSTDIPNGVSIPPYVTPLRIYGLMQVNDRRGFLTQKIYKDGTDYRFIGPPTYPFFNAPYIAWDPVGDEPTTGSFYEITYITEKNIPHNQIKVFNNITYNGSFPKGFYIHSHKAPGTSLFPWTGTHQHGEIFGLPTVSLMSANAPNDYFRTALGYYDWDYNHIHEITSGFITNTVEPNSFFKWADNAFKPTVSSVKIAPLLAPNNVNFKTQRKYADQTLKIILNKNLSKDANGDFNSLDEIPEDRENGYYNMNGGMLDFRSTYFGNDLKYSNGGSVLPSNSKITDTATIFVNDNPLSSNYMKVETSQIDPNYHAYIYRQIPRNGTSISNDGKYVSAGGVIFVRDGVIRIGGASYKGNVTGTAYTNTLGNNTIIDGALTIISYTETKPSLYVDNNINTSTDNKGDIVITGNVIYRNKINPWESQVTSSNYNYNGFVQVDPQTSTSVTNTDGSNVVPFPVGNKINGLALIASNDIKIPVMHYKHPSILENHYTTPSEEASPDCPCKDTLTIVGQLIAGHQLTQTKVQNGDVSKNDRLILYGSIYSYLPPNLSYFDRTDPNNREEQGLGRIYLYDKTLSQVQLVGAPSFPYNTSYDFSQYPVIGLNLPRIVPGTWKVVTDGAQ